jgi:hypothetical protein
MGVSSFDLAVVWKDAAVSRKLANYVFAGKCSTGNNGVLVAKAIHA